MVLFVRSGPALKKLHSFVIKDVVSHNVGNDDVRKASRGNIWWDHHMNHVLYNLTSAYECKFMHSRSCVWFIICFNIACIKDGNATREFINKTDTSFLLFLFPFSLVLFSYVFPATKRQGNEWFLCFGDHNSW